VSALVSPGAVVVGWIGDSRAYWLPAEGGADQLTVDDSRASQAIALGADPQLALAGPGGHAITAWLGADSPDTDPRVGVHRATAPGHLVLCSDGLWNYLPDPDAFAATVREHLGEAAGNPLAAARSLTAYANAEGGADNITIVLIPVVVS
jgi:serine/threonine protein phosphatase PrpC